jgi:hypothetical protein
MVNTWNSLCNGQPSNNNNNSNNNVNLEQLITTQNQLMQAVLQTLNNMQPNQQAHQQQAPPPPAPHQSRLAEFLRTRPTTFSKAKDPMETEDWLKGVKKKLMTAQCHTPFRERGNEASIHVPRMFKSHAWQQYDKQMQCYK